MTLISFSFYVFLALTLFIYYSVPCKYRRYILLVANVAFYAAAAFSGLWLLGATILLSYLAARLLQARREATRRPLRLYFVGAILLVVAPLLYAKIGTTLFTHISTDTPFAWVAPLGLSFYTLQIIAYLADIWQGKIDAEKNLCKYALFISFFPQIIQGPIPRYAQLSEQLWQGHRFNEVTFTKGLHYILWGFFLKMMIADKAAIIASEIFDSYPQYTGFYIFIGAFLYSIQLYTDFLACTYLARGIAKLFGISLINNFNHPYLATSVKDFWGRWHLSLSHWLRDYIYIPLGGNRKGKLRKYWNITLTFLISGIWHGSGPQFIAWGLLHAGYQIGGEISAPMRNALSKRTDIAENSLIKTYLQRMITTILICYAWILFRANGLGTGIGMILGSVTVWNPWVLFDLSLFTLGLNAQECFVLFLCILLLMKCSVIQQKTPLSDWVLAQRIIVRWCIYLVAISSIVIFGAYGTSFNASSFIYGGF